MYVICVVAFVTIPLMESEDYWAEVYVICVDAFLTVPLIES